MPHADPEAKKAYLRAWRAANKERTRAFDKARRPPKPARVLLTDDEKAARKKAWRDANRERLLAAKKADHAKNREKRKAMSRARYAARKAEYAERAAAYRAANPDLVRAHRRNRRAAKRAAEGRHTAADIKAIFDTQDGRCLVCRTDLAAGYHVDHWMPLARGGSNGPGNLRLLCPPCNLRKRAKHPGDFALEVLG